MNRPLHSFLLTGAARLLSHRLLPPVLGPPRSQGGLYQYSNQLSCVPACLGPLLLPDRASCCCLPCCCCVRTFLYSSPPSPQLRPPAGALIPCPSPAFCSAWPLLFPVLPTLEFPGSRTHALCLALGFHGSRIRRLLSLVLLLLLLLCGGGEEEDFAAVLVVVGCWVVGLECQR